MPAPLLDREPRRAGSVDDPCEPLVSHLIELRWRLIVCLSYLGLGTVLGYGWSGAMLDWLARGAGGVVFTRPAEAFMVRLQAAALMGLLVFLPLMLHQAWLFVARALDPSWRRHGVALAAASYALALLGAALGVFIVAPVAMRVLLGFGSEPIRPLMTLSGYLGFVAGLALSFAAVFQLPVALFVLNRMGLVSRLSLRERRRYVYLLAFIAAAILTPGPDVFSQLALALPGIAVFELTLLALR